MSGVKVRARIETKGGHVLVLDNRWRWHLPKGVSAYIRKGFERIPSIDRLPAAMNRDAYVRYVASVLNAEVLELMPQKQSKNPLARY